MFKFAVSYQTSNTTSQASGTTLTLTKPTGTVDGDLLITAIALRTNGTLPTTLSGWTLILSQNSDGSGSPTQIAIYYRIASSEGSNYAWTVPSTIMHGIVIRINGQNASGFIDASESGGNNGGGTSMTFGSTGLTPTKSESLLLQFWAPFNLSSLTNSVSAEAIATSNPSWTEICDLDVNNAAQHIGLAVAYANRTATSATGASTATAGTTTFQYVGALLVIRRITDFTASVIDTVTDTDVISPQAGYKKTVSDTVTPSDAIVATKGRAWSNDAKIINTTWANDQKS